VRVLIAADIHGDREALLELLRREFDIFVIVGDLTNRYRERELFKLLPEATIFIPGNNEPPEAGVHGCVKEVGEYEFICLGGSLPTPFNTLFEIPDAEYGRILSGMHAGRKTIVFSHCPPYGVLDRVGSKNIGSHALREFIEREKPLAVFVAHVHEHAGELAFLDGIPVFNPGKKGLILEL